MPPLAHFNHNIHVAQLLLLLLLLLLSSSSSFILATQHKNVSTQTNAIHDNNTKIYNQAYNVNELLTLKLAVK
jgi:hypothetical protein